MPSRPTIVFMLVCLVVPSPAGAQSPVIPLDECTYLVGVPVGGHAALTESSGSSVIAYPTCVGLQLLDVNRDRPHSIVFWSQAPPGAPNDCTARARVYTEFTAPSQATSVARVVTTGACRVELRSASGGGHATAHDISVRLVLSRMDTTGETTLASSEVMHYEGVGETVNIDEPFAAELVATALPDMIHRLSLELRATGFNTSTAIDFGSPGSGRGLWYDSIEVCLEDPNSGVNARLAALEDRDLELRLYQRECLPTVWMPAAQGGRLEQARSLAGDLLARATATAAPGVNTRVAAMRIASADTDIATGDFQRACRECTNGLG
jgi:hypothetical protein